MPKIADLPLYPSEQQISEAVIGPGRLQEWKGMAHVLERDGLPKIDPLFGRRYWPAIRQYFDRRNRVAPAGAPPEKTIWLRTPPAAPASPPPRKKG